MAHVALDVNRKTWRAAPLRALPSGLHGRMERQALRAGLLIHVEGDVSHLWLRASNFRPPISNFRLSPYPSHQRRMARFTVTVSMLKMVL